jgi:hypothetical protein
MRTSKVRRTMQGGDWFSILVLGICIIVLAGVLMAR